MRRAERRRVRGLSKALEVGARVFLRRATERDRDEYLGLVRRSRAFLRPWEPRVRDPGGHGRFDRILASRRGGRSVKTLVCRLEDGAVLGAVNLNDVVRGVFQSATMGYWVGAEHARQGFMTEAVALALRHAFGTLGLHRVEANFMPSNRASRALARRSGFRREGYSPRYLRIAGRWQDHERWAILVEDWRRRRR
jgi:ribosomal-protein-alanine N-acetyltransferase